MKKIILVLIFVSCSSSDKNDFQGKTDNDLDWIKASDFNSPRLITYNSSRDTFKHRSKDSLSRESLSRVPQSELTENREVQNRDGVSSLLKLCYKRKFKQAFSFVQKEYQRYTKHPGFWNAVGSCYILNGDNKKALLFYKKSHEIDRRYTPAQNNLGVLYQREGKLKKAYDTFSGALRTNNFSSTPLFNMAQIDLRHGLVDKSLSSFLALYQRDSGDVDVLNALGTIYLMKGDLKKALSFYSKINPNYYKRGDIGVNVSVALYLANQKQKAADVIDSVSVGESSPMYSYSQRVKRFIREGK